MRWRLITLSSPIKDKYLHEWVSQPIVSNPEISSCSDTKPADMSNMCFNVRLFCNRDWMTFVQVILSYEYCWSQCYSHEKSPNHGMFLSIFCNIWNSFLSFSHLIIHPVHECLIPSTFLILFHRFQWQIVVALLFDQGKQRVSPLYQEVFPRS